MRQIKFRVWDEDFNRMFDWSDLLRLKTTFNALYGSEGIVIMQYTGLNDCNDVEVYEGDIIRFFPYHSEYQVVFGDCSFCLADLKGRIIESLFDGMGEITVIGNIYENPELLRGDIE